MPPPRTWTIKEILAVTSKYLESKGIDSPRLNAELLLGHLLHHSRLELYLHFDQPLNEDEIEGYRGLVRRRVQREPLQYIRGVQEFWSLDFRVSPGVLIPRPETELLVEESLKLYKGGALGSGDSPRILDLCTGSGVLAVCLAKEIPGAKVHGSDISKGALEIARQNAARHGVSDRISFFSGGLFQPFLNKQEASFGLILSNPPYVPTEEMKGLQPEIRDHEPRCALDGGPDGMRYIREILRQAPAFLASRGWLLVELDPRQVEEAMGLAEEAGLYDEVSACEDYGRLKRVLKAMKKA